MPLALGLLWTWLNPRFFATPATTDRWSSKAVFGERVWGIVQLAIWPTVLGVVVQYASKFWFLERMVWLFEDVRGTDPRYERWAY